MFYLSFYSFILSFLIPQFSSQENNLHFVFEHFRHGARTPSKFINFQTLTDFFGISWEGNGELTQTGIIQQYILGLRNRHKYGDFYNKNFDPREFLVYSTNLNRTIMSAQAHLAGMFSDVSIPLTQISELDKPPVNITFDIKGTINFMPVPIHTYEERVIAGEKVIELTMNFDRDVNCPKIKELRDKNKSIPKVIEFLNKFNDNYFTFFKENYQIKDKFDFATIHSMCDAYIANYFYNNTLKIPEIIENKTLLEVCYEFEAIKQLDVEQDNKSKKAGTITSSSTMRKMIKWMESRIEINDQTKLSYENPKYVIYSAHDTTLSAMQRFLMDSFNINYTYPIYSSVMHFELRKYKDFRVIYYFNDHLVFNLTFKDFKDKVMKIAWKDEDVYDYCVGTSKLEQIVLILGIIICVVIATIIVLMCYYCKKDKKGKGDFVKEVDSSNPDGLGIPGETV